MASANLAAIDDTLIRIRSWMKLRTKKLDSSAKIAIKQDRRCYVNTGILLLQKKN